jgi:hypothetical protein
MFPCAQSRNSLLFILLSASLAMPLAARQGENAAKPADGGFDFFRTVAGSTKYTFSGDFIVPAGFFGPNSERFNGKVTLKGAPLGTFHDHKTGRADTVLHRSTTPAAATRYPSETKTEIELAALSLVSTEPVKIKYGRKTELWDVKVGLSPSHTSTGSMTFTQRNRAGGTASSELSVYPLFTFVRRGDKTERTLDAGKLNLGPDSAKELTLRASNIPWSRQARPAGPLSDVIQVGTPNTPILKRSTGSGGGKNHGIIRVPPPVFLPN